MHLTEMGVAVVLVDTMLGDVAEALLLNRLVVYQVLDLRGGAVHIGVLQ